MCGGCFGLGPPVAETCVVIDAEVEEEVVEAEAPEEWPKCKGYDGKGCKHNNPAGPKYGTKYGLCDLCKEKKKGYDDARANKRKREAMENPAPEGHQRCTGFCKKIHPISEFPTRNDGTTGKVCRACRASDTKSKHDEATAVGKCNKVIKDFKEASACVDCGCNDCRLITGDHVYPRGSITDKNDWRYPLMKRPDEPNPCDAEGWAAYGGAEALRKRLQSGAVVARCVFCHNLKDNAQTSKDPRLVRRYAHFNRLKHERCECAICKLAVVAGQEHAFHFDHPPGVEKLFNVTDLVSHVSEEVFQKHKYSEPAKCILLCASCHHLVSYYNEPRPPHDPERWIPPLPLQLVSTRRFWYSALPAARPCTTLNPVIAKLEGFECSKTG